MASASSGGTISAVRHLGACGFDVGVVSSDLLGAAAWSRHAARTYSAPPESESERFLERLLVIGASEPGQVLLPTSDETAWLYAANSDELGRHFRLVQPSLTVLRNILDKKLFSKVAVDAGFPVLPSWDPQTIDEVAELAPTLPYPVLIKPRTHVHRLRNDKGVVAHSSSELKDKYQRYVAREQTRSGRKTGLRETMPPILQKFVHVGAEGVLSVTGFIDRTGELFVTRSATKVFQRSQPVGVGVCFESRPQSEAMSEAVRRLCGELGYFGIFEVEFLWSDGRWTAIDFNPRLFNQIGMDIRRGLPLPLLACLECAGEISALREAILRAREYRYQETVFCDRFTLQAILVAQTITRRISSKNGSYWRRWMNLNTPNTVDFVAEKGDRIPEFIHILSEIYLGLRSFPRFLRSTPSVSPQTHRLLSEEPL
jgi:D-aspartate ligase